MFLKKKSYGAREKQLQMSTLMCRLPVPEHIQVIFSCRRHRQSDKPPAQSSSPDRGRFHATWRCWGVRRRVSGRRFPSASVPPSYSKAAKKKGSQRFNINVHRRLTNTAWLLYRLLTILTAYFCPVFLCVQRLQMEKLPSPKTLSLRSIS